MQKSIYYHCAAGFAQVDFGQYEGQLREGDRGRGDALAEQSSQSGLYVYAGQQEHSFLPVRADAVDAGCGKCCQPSWREWFIFLGAGVVGQSTAGGQLLVQPDIQAEWNGYEQSAGFSEYSSRTGGYITE